MFVFVVVLSVRVITLPLLLESNYCYYHCPSVYALFRNGQVVVGTKMSQENRKGNMGHGYRCVRCGDVFGRTVGRSKVKEESNAAPNTKEKAVIVSRLDINGRSEDTITNTNITRRKWFTVRNLAFGKRWT